MSSSQRPRSRSARYASCSSTPAVRLRIRVCLCLALILGATVPAEAGLLRRAPAGATRAGTAKPGTHSVKRRLPARARQRLRQRLRRAKPGAALATTTTTAGARAARAQRPIARAAARAVTGVRALGRWMKAHPVITASLVVGFGAMLGVALVAAPALKVAVSGLLAPLFGASAAAIIGTGVGGALASGARSLMVYATPMAVGHDPWNKKQLAADVGMSAGFGFVGFAQAALLTAVTGSVVTGVVATGAAMLVGLVGWELVKDYLQIRIRNRVATYPKNFWDRKTFKRLATMEFLSNAHRALPGLGTSYIAKVAGDLIGTVLYDRIVNARNQPSDGDEEEEKARSTERKLVLGQ